MRLISYRSEGGERAGVLRDGRIVDAGDAMGGDPASLRALLEVDALGELASAAEGAEASIALAEVELLPPIPDPEKIVCIGLNYSAHAAEAGIEPPPVPTFFASSPTPSSPTGRACRCRRRARKSTTRPRWRS